MDAIRLSMSTATRATPTRRRASWRGSRSRGTAILLCALVWTLLVAVTPAYAVPPPPPNPSNEQIGAADSAKQAAAAEVGRISGELAAAEAELARLGIVTEAATYEYLAAEGRLLAAQEAAEQSAADFVQAQEEVEGAQAAIVEFARGSFKSGSLLTNDMVLLTSQDPSELIQRAAFLDYISSGRLDVLNNLEVARVTVANSDSINRAAEIEMAAAEKAAEAAKAAADAAFANGAVMVSQVQAQKASLDAQLRDAQVALLGLEGARALYESWEAQKRAEEAAAAERSRIAAEQAAAAERAARAAAAAAAAQPPPSSGGGGGGSPAPPAPSPGPGPAPVASSGIAPTSGSTTSCFGPRWGTFHYGVDIGAPIGNPVYTPLGGRVSRAGAASGFGQAVYITHDNGNVTVYGHVSRIFVSTGQRVYEGQNIAAVGNEGQSTGPHLHFEVHTNGNLYGNAINPVPWLEDLGIYLPGNC